MTDNKMREGKLWAFMHDSLHEAYKKLSTTGTSNEYYALLDSIASKVADDVDARFLQAAQSEQAVAVVECNHLWMAGPAVKGGHPVEGPFVAVCSKCGAAPSLLNDDPLAAELERLRKDAERYRWLRYNSSYSIHEMLFGKPAFITTHKESDLDDAIDAAIQERQS